MEIVRQSSWHFLKRTQAHFGGGLGKQGRLPLDVPRAIAASAKLAAISV